VLGHRAGSHPLVPDGAAVPAGGSTGLVGPLAIIADELNRFIN